MQMDDVEQKDLVKACGEIVDYLAHLKSCIGKPGNDVPDRLRDVLNLFISTEEGQEFVIRCLVSSMDFSLGSHDLVDQLGLDEEKG
jgi:hypothetical protein